MTNDTTRTMPTAEDIKIVIDKLEEYPRSGEARLDAIRMLRFIEDHLRDYASDAMRYRCLKDMHNAGHPQWFVYGAGDKLNEDIDAAMKEDSHDHPNDR